MRNNFYLKGSWRWLVAAGAVFVPATVLGALTIPHSFTPNTPIKAAEVNANFSALKTGVDAIGSRVDAVDDRVDMVDLELASMNSGLANKQDKPPRGAFLATATGKFGARQVACGSTNGVCTTQLAFGLDSNINSAGKENKAERTGAGQYKVTFGGLGHGCQLNPVTGQPVCSHIGIPMVTAIGANSTQCKIHSWRSAGLANNDTEALVRCYNPSGTLTDSAFSIQVSF